MTSRPPRPPALPTSLAPWVAPSVQALAATTPAALRAALDAAWCASTPSAPPFACAWLEPAELFSGRRVPSACMLESSARIVCSDRLRIALRVRSNGLLIAAVRALLFRAAPAARGSSTADRRRSSRRRASRSLRICRRRRHGRPWRARTRASSSLTSVQVLAIDCPLGTTGYHWVSLDTAEVALPSA